MHEEIFGQAFPLAVRSAQVRARAAVARGFIQPADREDAEQEAVTACFRALSNYDPERASLPTFLECIVSSRIASLMRSARRRQLTLRPLEFATDHCVDSAFGRHELRIDIEHLLGECTDSDRRLAFNLMQYSPSETSQKLGIARSTVYQGINRLRGRFIAAGLMPDSISRGVAR